MAEPLWTSAEIAAATGGKLSGDAFVATGVSIDTRSIEPGDLFVALGGVRDGHEFVDQARGKGAAGALAARLLAALRAGLDAGGEAGPVHSAGLLVVRDVEWPIVDLRVDWSDDPIGALEGAWAVYAPQVEDYVRRAIDPVAAPRFGVPGDP